MSPKGRPFKRFAALSFLAAVSVPAQILAGGVDSAAATRIDAWMETLLVRTECPAAAVAVADSSGIRYSRGYGTLGRGRGAPDGRTPFFIASVSKTVGAFVARSLADEGVLDLDAPASRYVPTLVTADGPLPERLTVRSLVEQTSGFGTAAGNDPEFFDTRASSAEMSAKFSAVRLEGLPGASYRYSNLNYVALGLVLEAAAGKPYAELVSDHVFRPLRLTRSYTSRGEAEAAGLPASMRLLFGWPAPYREPFVPGMLAGGYLLMSAQDLATWGRAYLGDGVVDGVDLLPAGPPSRRAAGGSWDLYWSRRLPSAAGVSFGFSGGLNSWASRLVVDGAADRVVVVLFASRTEHRDASVDAARAAAGVERILDGKEPMLGPPRDQRAGWGLYRAIFGGAGLLAVFLGIRIPGRARRFFGKSLRGRMISIVPDTAALAAAGWGFSVLLGTGSGYSVAERLSLFPDTFAVPLALSGLLAFFALLRLVPLVLPRRSGRP